MKIYRKDEVTIFMSNDIHQEYQQIFDKENDELSEIGYLLGDAFRECLVIRFVDNYLNAISEDQWEYIELFAAKYNMPRIAMLIAHGFANGPDWYIRDNEKEIPLQNWLDRHDGRYSCIYCNVCNPLSQTIKTKKSLLIIPDAEISGTLLNMTVATLACSTQLAARSIATLFNMNSADYRKNNF